MKKQITLIYLLSVLFIQYAGLSIAKADQFVQLFVNNFDNATEVDADFELNSTELGNENGVTQWIVNDQYKGYEIYPDTPGNYTSIEGNPYTPYLHTYDSNKPDYANANYDVNEASDIFVVMKEGVCTYRLDKVRLVFFYVGGDDNSYMEVYYNINQNGWISSGQTYTGADDWKYVELLIDDFKDVSDLRFGFRFVSEINTGSGMGFGMDDMQIVGEYDEDDPVSINLNSIPESVCEGSEFTLEYEIEDTLCTGTYHIELSNSAGNFPPTFIWLRTIEFSVIKDTFNLMLPINIPPGSCYKFRMIRMTQPQIISEISDCFEIEDCDNIIVTNGPAMVLTDPDDPWISDSILPSICAGSAIDIPFNSWGVFNPGNYYIIQMSNPQGNWDFGTFWSNLGSKPDDKQYPSTPVGSVGGLIPGDVPEGCNYYLRIVSSFPGTIGEVWGPFCIRHCDIETNNKKDINICITEYEGAEVAIEFAINIWNDDAEYPAGNIFEVELRDFNTFELFSKGDWLKEGNEAGTFTMEVPNLPDLSAMNIYPGKYYMRMVASSSSEPDDIWGTWIRLIIGSPEVEPTQISVDPTKLCIDGIACFSIVSPEANPNSTYDWYINGTLQGTWPGLYATHCWRFEQPGEYTIQTQETNYGCKGPLSPPAIIQVMEPPPSVITGPDELCQGEEACFEANFLEETYYHWEIEGATILSDNGSIICIKVDDEAENLSIDLQTLNACGNGEDQKNIPIEPAPYLENPGTHSICLGSELNLEIITTAENILLKDSAGNTIISTTENSISFQPQQNALYTLIAQTEGLCDRSETFWVNAIDMESDFDIVSNKNFQEICVGDTVIFTGTYIENTDYSWTLINGVDIINIDNHQITVLIKEQDINLVLEINSPCGDSAYSRGISDINCTVAISDTKDSPANVYFFPNPSQNKNTTLFYTLKDKSYRVKLNLYDVTGRWVNSVYLPSTKNQQNIDLQSLSSGIYLFTLIGQDGTILNSGKLVVD